MNKTKHHCFRSSKKAIDGKNIAVAAVGYRIKLVQALATSQSLKQKTGQLSSL
jgi:hypothetical protein